MDGRLNQYVKNVAAAKNRRKWYKAVTLMAAVVVFCTTYALILPAITMEKSIRVLECPLEVHKHDSSCRDQNNKLVCGMADFVVHKHNSDCYDADGNLYCALSEIERHEHKDGCYKKEKNLICTTEETAGHVHKESCFEKQKGALVCTTAESQGHAHGEGCKDEEGNLICTVVEQEAHAHGEACFQWNDAVICGLQEGEGSHAHGDDCYKVEKTLACDKHELHKHDSSCKNGNECEKLELQEHVHGEGCFQDVVIQETETESELETDSETEAESENNAENEPEVKDETDTEVETEAESESGTEAEAEAESETDTEVETEAESESGTESETEAESESGTESEMETESETDIEVETEAESESGTESETEIESEVSSEEETESESEIESGKETENITNSWNGTVTVQIVDGIPEIGNEITLSGIVEGIPEELPVSWQWQYCSTVSVGPQEEWIWRNINGAVGQNFTLAVTEENASWYLRVLAILEIPQSLGDSGYIQKDGTEEKISETIESEETVLLLTGIENVLSTAEYYGTEEPSSTSDEEIVLISDVYSLDELMPLAAGETDGVFKIAFRNSTATITVTCLDQDGNVITSLDHTDYSLPTGFKYTLSGLVPTGDGCVYESAHLVNNGQEYTIQSIKGDGDDVIFYNGTAECGRANNANVILRYTRDKKETMLFWFWVCVDDQWKKLDINGNYADDGNAANAWNAISVPVYQINAGEPNRNYIKASDLTSIYGKYGFNATDSRIASEYHIAHARAEDAGTSIWSESVVTVDGEYYIPMLNTWNLTERCNVYYLPGQGTRVVAANQNDLAVKNSFYSVTVYNVDGTSEETYYLTGTDVNLTLAEGENWYVSAKKDGTVSSLADGIFAVSNISQSYTIRTVSLNYNLNKPEKTIMGSSLGYGSWENSPWVTVRQVVNDGTKLQSVQNKNSITGYFVHRLWNIGHHNRFEEDNRKLQNAGLLTKETYRAPGREFKFEGWEATIDGQTWLFAEEAEIQLEEDGIHLVDVNGVSVVVPMETTLTGKWSQVSDIVTFFVNYSGTILDTEGDVKDRPQGDFTPKVAIGHIYYGRQKVGNDGVFATEVDQTIRSMFAYQGGLRNDGSTQIVLDYVTSPTNEKAGNCYTPAANFLGSQLDNSVLHYISETMKNKTISDPFIVRISSADKTTTNANNPEIDPSNADNYQVRWYVVKEEATDGIHVDGVLIAKTSEIRVTKRFSGLPNEQVQALMEQFSVGLKLGPKNQSYITMNTSGMSGTYEYLEKEASGNIYNWNLHGVYGEQYTMEEQNYELADYDCTEVVSVHNNDGTISVHSGSSTYASSEGAKAEVIAGKTTSVSFNNFYTKKGTGAFTITKLREGAADGDASGKLAGAQFTLYDSSGSDPVILESCANPAVTNVNGAVTFSNLPAGTYILKETKAPEGYESIRDTSWEIVVTNAEDGNRTMVTVTLQGEDDLLPVVCYEFVKETDLSGNTTTSGSMNAYSIYNKPADNTITVNKTFQGVTSSDVEKLKAAGYQIKLVSENGKNEYILRLQNGTDESGGIGYSGVSADGMTFNWQLPNVPPGSYKVTEMNYTGVTRTDSDGLGYKDIIVTARGHSSTDSDGNPYTTQISSVTEYENDAGEAFFTVTLVDNAMDSFTIKNQYINKAELQLKKVDAKDYSSVLAGAKFDIYGPPEDALKDPEVTTYLHTDKEGNSTWYGRIGSITTDEYGRAVFGASATDVPVRLGETYLLIETEEPDGYLKLTKPIVLDVSTTSNNYSGGVYSVVVENVNTKDAYVLPETGGTGTECYTVTGSICVLITAWMLLDKKKQMLIKYKKKCEKQNTKGE